MIVLTAPQHPRSVRHLSLTSARQRRTIPETRKIIDAIPYSWVKKCCSPPQGGFIAAFSSEDPECTDKMRSMFGPGHVDQGVRQAIQVCWMMLPKDGKTVDELDRQIRRIVDRAIKDLREDSDAFRL